MYAQQTAETEHRDSISQKSSAVANRTGVPDNMKRQYEAMSGLSMDDVRVHYNSGKPSQLGALAYTQGSHVYVAPGQERHLGHELGHVIQQKQGRVRATESFDDIAVNLDDRLEREADDYDRQANAYGAEDEEIFRERHNNISGIGTGTSGGVTQLRPMVDSRRRRPFYVDDKYNQTDKPRFLLKLFVEMGQYVVFQIRDHVRRIFWEKDQKWIDDNRELGSPDIQASEQILEDRETDEESGSPDIQAHEPIPERRKTDEDKYYTDREFTNEFDIEEFLKIQPLDAWIETYEEAMAALAEIDANTALSPEEKKRQKDAITNYVLQRHIVNALYRAEELDRMEYSGSPLSYQDRSSYMRSGAGSFADALKKLLLEKDGENHGYQNGKKNKNNMILIRSGKMQQELDKFFQYFKLEAPGLESRDDVFQTILYAMDNLDETGKIMDELMESLIFIDATNLEGITPTDIKGILNREISRYIDQNKGTRSRQLQNMQSGSGNLDEINRRLQQPEERRAFLRWYTRSLREQRMILLSQIKEAPEAEIQNLEIECGELETQIQNAELFEQSSRNLTPEDSKMIDAYTTYVEHWTTKQFTKQQIEAIDQFVMIGKTISLTTGGIEQSALMLADTKTDRQIKAAVNKAGYVPSVTEAIRKLAEYTDQGEGRDLSIKEIALKVFDQQKSRWSKGRADKTQVERRMKEKPGESQYGMADMENARELAQTYFISFCQELVNSPEMNKPENRRIFVQASTVKKLIEASHLFENDRIPAFVWYQLDYYLDAALHSRNHLVDFTRNIQAIHEIILLGIELQEDDPLSRGEEFRLAAPEAEGPGAELYRGAYLADYGLKAFAQVYDAAIAQHAADTADDPKAADVAAFYNIYFELTEKLNATTGANPGRVHMKAPENVAQFIKELENSELKTGERAENKIPDIIMIDIHPNDATKKLITQNDVAGMLNAINGCRTQDSRKKITVIVDITLNQATDDEVVGIRNCAADYLADGWLNLVFVQSLTKFAQMGMDKHSGGLVFSYNRADKWEQFNGSLQESRQADPVDPYMQRYFQLLFDNAADEQKKYIDIIRENTRYVQEQLRERLEATAITLSVNDDPGSCYVAWHYEKSYAAVCELYKKYTNEEKEPYSLHGFNIAILEKGINVQMSKCKLPVAMRFSFGFPISNLGETGNEVRFTIGTETREELDEYINRIGFVGDKVQELIRQIDSDSLQEGISRDTLFELEQFERYLETLPI